MSHEHKHKHDETCACGHEHEHGETCACGHVHVHARGDDCDCGHHHEAEVFLSATELNFLALLLKSPILPVCSFVMKSSASDDVEAVALAPVFLASGNEAMEQIKETAAVLSALESYGLIDIDYSDMLEKYDYSVYVDSEIFKFFVETVKESATKPGVLFDTAALEAGSMALTQLGAEVAEKLCE